MAAKKDGTLLGMRVVQYVDVGAYHGTFGAFQPVACLMAGGAYKWKGISARTVGVLTNRVPTDPYRGAGRPEATHLVERHVLGEPVALVVAEPEFLGLRVPVEADGVAHALHHRLDVAAVEVHAQDLRVRLGGVGLAD